MKISIKTILLFFMTALLITSCSSDDPTPPKAGFTMEPSDVVQWDTAEVTDTSTGSDPELTTYAVTGGAFTFLGKTIQFLEAKTYTITQTVKNEDGSNSYSATVDVAEPNNYYIMSFYSDQELSLDGKAYWFDSFETLQIRIDGVGGDTQETNNLIKVNPVPGADPIYGDYKRSYTWSTEGEIGTYNGEFTHYPATGDSFDAAWFTATAGNGLDITLIYDADSDEDNVYDIKMMDTTLDGYYDSSFNPQDGEGILLLSYRGEIYPIQ